MINVTGLWKHTSSKGKTYLSGTVGGFRVLIFPNEKKTADNHPDYTLCLDENKPKQTQESQSSEETDISFP